MKFCALCKKYKKLFYHPYDSYCIKCRKKWRRKYYKKNREQQISKSLEYQRLNKDAAYENSMRWQLNNPKKAMEIQLKYKRKNRLAILLYGQLKHYVEQDGRW